MRAFGRQDHERARFAERNQAHRVLDNRLYRLMATYWSVSDGMTFAQKSLVVGAGVYWVSRGELAVGAFFYFLTAVGMFMYPLRQMGRIVADLGKATVALRRLREILDHPIEADAPEPVAIGASAGAVRFDRVTFRYAPEGAPALDALSFEIPARSTAAFVGASGAGKTTLIALLLRLYDPAVTGRDNEALLSRIDAEPDRYAEVPRFTRMYRLMTEFVDTVGDDHLARLLDTALTSREAFRRFEGVLGAWPQEQARWRAYRQAALIRWVVAWLRSLRIEPDWELPLPPDEASPSVPELLQVALLGAPAGSGARVYEAPSEDEARERFVRLARQLCELRCEPFLARTLEGRTRFARGGIEIRRERRRVILSVLA